jgi:prephenate dehydrogenase
MLPRRIGIVGLGLIGGSLALALKRADRSLHVLGVDRDERTRREASGLIDEAVSLDDASFEECELVVLALPAQPLLELLPSIASRMRAGAILTDVCGAKERICEAGAAVGPRVPFIGGHPMAGTEYRGFSAARESLFDGCTVVLCQESAPVRAMWTAAGAGGVIVVAPEEHDRAVTYASHLPYLAAAAVVEALRSQKEAAPLAAKLAAGGFRDTTRLAGDGTVSGAAALNRFVPEAARSLSEILRALARQLEQDPAAVLRHLESLADERRQMKLPPAR